METGKPTVNLLDSSLLSGVNLVARLAAVVLGFTYGAGFVVVSIHLGEFGVAPFGLFRPKFMAAGVLFLFFVALPALAAARSFGFLPGGKYPEPTGAAYSMARLAWNTHRVVGLYISVNVLAMLTSVFFKTSPLDWRALVVVATYVLVAMGFAYAVTSAELSVRGAVLSALCAGLLMKISSDFASHDFQVRALWFLLAALLVEEIRRQWPKLRRLEGPWPEVYFVLAISMAGIFAGLLYPRIKPELGGGAPSPAVIQFYKPPPFGRSDRSPVWVLDETDNGYYVLRSKAATKAVFLPRSAVKAIYFGDAMARERHM